MGGAAPSLPPHLLPPVRGTGGVWRGGERHLCCRGVLRAALELRVKPAAEGVHGPVLEHAEREAGLRERPEAGMEPGKVLSSWALPHSAALAKPASRSGMT